MSVRIDTCKRCGVDFEQELQQGRPFSLCEGCRAPRPPRPVAPPRASLAPWLQSDPLPREDGRCALPSCGQLRKLSKVARKYAGEQLDRDPFCSAVCCRRYYGVTFASDADVDVELSELRSSAARAQNAERKQAMGIIA